jgi:hypothetical protein
VKVLLYKDDTLSISMGRASECLNRLVGDTISFGVGDSPARISGGFVRNPKSYDGLSSALRSEASGADLVIILTKKRYDNNYFWDPPNGNVVIVSCFMWEELTTLPISNGLIYTICCLLAGHIGLRVNLHREITGCINDLLWRKTGIDICMRSAFICEDCIRKFSKIKLTGESQAIYGSLLLLLNDLSAASRANSDILSFWTFKAVEKNFDVFLCHNSQDKDDVRKTSEALKREGIRPWLDEEQIQPGRAWQDELEACIPTIASVAIFVGESGFGPWQNVEARAFIQEFVKRQCPVIPVILPDSTIVPQLPIFLKQLMWVDFRKKDS